MEDKIIKVKCIYNNNGHYHLTIGKKYKIEYFTRIGYAVLNDKNKLGNFFEKCFETIKYTAEEIFDEPVGTEFNIKYSDGSISSQKVKTTSTGCIVWENGKTFEFNKKHTKVTFMKLEKSKPVGFMDLTNSKNKCRVEHPKVDEMFANKDIIFDMNIIAESFALMQKGEYIDLDNIMLVISRYLGDKYLKQVIKDGKWYLED